MTAKRASSAAKSKSEAERHPVDDRRVDEALEETFPASDPIAVPFPSLCQRKPADLLEIRARSTRAYGALQITPFRRASERSHELANAPDNSSMRRATS